MTIIDTSRTRSALDHDRLTIARRTAGGYFVTLKYVGLGWELRPELCPTAADVATYCDSEDFPMPDLSSVAVTA